MKNRNIVFALIGVIITVCLGLFIYYESNHKPIDAKKFVEQIREENKAGFDSLQKAFDYDDELNYRINEAINKGDFKTAHTLLDSLPPFGKKMTVLRYEGMIFEKKGDYLNALEKYNLAINNYETPLTLEKRAAIYIKLNRLDDAMHDYKKAFEWNYDFSLPVAKTFELMNKKDSALKYYQIYLEHYPADSFVQQRVLVLKK